MRARRDDLVQRVELQNLDLALVRLEREAPLVAARGEEVQHRLPRLLERGLQRLERRHLERDLETGLGLGLGLGLG